MAVGDTTITFFQAGDTVEAKTKIEALGIINGDIVINWQFNNEVYVAKIETA